MLSIQLKGCYIMEINSKSLSFTIPILTASGLQLTTAVRIGIVNALEFVSIL